MDITKNNCYKLDICDFTNNTLWIEDDPGFNSQEINVISCPRIGINRAEEWISKPLRYYIFGNDYVSKRNKKVENEFMIKDND